MEQIHRQSHTLSLLHHHPGLMNLFAHGPNSPLPKIIGNIPARFKSVKLIKNSLRTNTQIYLTVRTLVNLNLNRSHFVSTNRAI